MNDSGLGISVRKTIVGRGVFATRAFRREQVIGQMRGAIVTDDDFDPSYAVDLGPGATLEPSAPFRYLNHSCTPNASLVMTDAEPGKRPTMWVEALRAIKPGEQITIDYAWPADDAIACLCGSPKCRGWVVAESALPTVRRRLQREARRTNGVAARLSLGA
jgi:hypothetical protein